MTVAMNNEPTWCPAIEFTETDKTLVLKAEVPGVERKQLNVRVNPDSVVITGVHPQAKRSAEKEIIPSELHYGRLQCNVPINVPIHANQAQAELVDGVLTITIPKALQESSIN